MTINSHPETTTRVPGRGWAYLGATLGGAVSIAANVAHSYVPPATTAGVAPIPADWSPQTGAVVGAIFWPVALFVAVEILARTAWPTGRAWTLLRLGGLLPVALVAAVVSYKHLAGLLAYYGEDPLTVAIGPLAVDGLMIMATGALLATGTRRTTTTDPNTASIETNRHTPVDGDDSPDTIRPVVDIPKPPADPTPDPAPAVAPTHLLSTARFAVVNHEQSTGRSISVDELAARLNITPAVAGDLLTLINPPAANLPARINGTPISGGAR